MKRTVSLLALALTVALTSVAFAGGEKCAHDAKAKAANSRKAELAAKGWLGLKTEKDAAGTYKVASVTPGSPAAQSGFRAGDVLVALNGVALTAANQDNVKKVKAGCAVGTEVAYTVRRDGSERVLKATLAAVPDAVLAEWMKEEDAAKKTQVAKNGL